MEELDSLMSDGQKIVLGAVVGAVLFSYCTYDYYGQEKRVNARGESEFTRNPKNYEVLERTKTIIRYRATPRDRMIPAGIAGVIGAVAGAYAAKTFFTKKTCEDNAPRRRDHYGNPSYNIDKARTKTQGKNLPNQQRRGQGR